MTPDRACPENVPLLLRAGDSTIEAGDLDRLEAHARSCAGCRAALQTQRQIHAVLAHRTPASASAGFARRVGAAIEQQHPAPWWERLDFKQWTWRIVPITAALALAAYLSGVASIASTTATPASTVSPTVSAALWSDQASADDVMALMLFADPNDTLSDALKEISQ